MKSKSEKYPISITHCTASQPQRYYIPLFVLELSPPPMEQIEWKVVHLVEEKKEKRMIWIVQTHHYNNDLRIVVQIIIFGINYFCLHSSYSSSEGMKQTRVGQYSVTAADYSNVSKYNSMW
jgi:hypothetical protein